MFIKALLVAFFVATLSMCVGIFSGGPGKSSPDPAPTPAAVPSVPKYSAGQIDSAKKIMENTRALAKVYEDGGMLVVEFNNYLFPGDINKRLNFVRSVADADAILTGSPRSIYFYNPGNKKIAQADRVNGVQLK
jgi:hypothetical protein